MRFKPRFREKSDKKAKFCFARFKPKNMDSSIAARVKSRSKRKRDDEVQEENPMDRPSLGERVLFCKLIRDGILKHFDPRKLTDLRYVLELRCFKGLLSDEDLKEAYFEQTWGYRAGDFYLDNWREMSVEELQDAICKSVLPHHRLERVVGTESDVRSLRTRDDLLRKYGWLRFVPSRVLARAVGAETTERRRIFILDRWFECTTSLVPYHHDDDYPYDD